MSDNEDRFYDSVVQETKWHTFSCKKDDALVRLAIEIWDGDKWVRNPPNWRIEGGLNKWQLIGEDKADEL